MKRKMIENTQPPATSKPKKDWWVEPQMVQNILVLNVYNQKTLHARHAINPETWEHETLKNGKWSRSNLLEAIGLNWYWWGYKDLERFNTSSESIGLIATALGMDADEIYRNIAENILRSEQNHDREKRWTAEEYRIRRMDDLMEKVPPEPDDLKEYACQIMTGGKQWMLKAEERGKWYCTSCKQRFSGKTLKQKYPKMKDGSRIHCPYCGVEVEYRARKKKIYEGTYITLVQPVNDEMAAVTHYRAKLEIWETGEYAILAEQMRVLIYRKAASRKDPYKLLYWQWPGRWDRHNPENCRTGAGYLYDAGIEEAFRETNYYLWGRLFTQMAAAGQKADYNRLMVLAADYRSVRTFEMLFRGRFYTLLCEQSQKIDLWNWRYYGPLDTDGNTAGEVLGIQDKQAINRLRNRDGNNITRRWLSYGEKCHMKISDKVLDWAEKHRVDPEDMQWVLTRMSPEKAMNYIERQRKDAYGGKNIQTVVKQYEDYMNMCQKLKKDMNDEMIYRPRELKRRHNECVEEIKTRQADIQAEEYSERYPEAEAVMQEIREKLEYIGEEYFIRVPQKIVDIVKEGNYLHHCVGSTDRYFDRIKDHETYICFLRKTAEPDTPFYTIEVEPGGTIRQHRGMFDEEPELDKVKPFLRIWQQEIRKRMKAEDHEREARSAILREKNIQELKERNNTRVLQSLREDFMAAVG